VSRQSPRVWIGEDEGQTALLIDGVVQSVHVDDLPLAPGYWPLMVPEVRPSRALILGLGGGTIVHLLFRRFGPVPVVAVEIDPMVIHLARSAFGLDRADVEIVEGDAFAFVADTPDRFDYVAVDLFARGKIPATIFTQPFLRSVKRILTPGGLAAFNFFADNRSQTRILRLEAVFPRVAIIHSVDNVIAYCRAR